MSEFYKSFSEDNFNTEFDKAFKDKSPKFDDCINIAVVGMVSTGKSSLINAVLECERSKPCANVGATSGVTKKVTAYQLDDKVLIIDCPGLDDVRIENSEVTKKFLKNIDLGIFIVTGSADTSQKNNYLDLKKNSKNIIVVLNKIDAWDDLEESEYFAVESQWKEALGTEKVFGCCTKGYDPKMRKDAPMDIRGVDEIRDEIFRFLEHEGKAILFAKHLVNKEKYATKLILVTIGSVIAEAFLPGGAVYITATQLVAITALYYLYTGKVMTKSSALSLLPVFAGQSIGSNIFLFAKSFLPPTGILDIAAAGIAAVITFAMLATVNFMLKNGYELESGDLLKSTFSKFKSAAKDIKWDDFKNPQRLSDIVGRLISK